MLQNLSRPARVLVLGGTSEIALAIVSALDIPADSQVLLAGRDEARLAAAAKELPFTCGTVTFDALELDTHKAVIDEVFAAGPVDLVIAATGVLTPQEQVDEDPVLGARMININFTSHVTTLLAAAGQLRAQGHGTIVVLSSIAAVRPRKANYVYGSAKSGLDAFARGLTDALGGSGVRVLLVRPGFVIGRMTRGMPAAPLSSTPAQVGTAVAAALEGGSSLLWVPRSLSVLAVVLRCVPRPLWRRMRR
ncbi:MAG TPA: SDR family NAD(P)-dependent oxidoreductase [Streptosporangiaceae bacterium]|nr:SDR family NAD(P)-dependent oxidoreductase [Streptosporangiaceae bacterium]